MRRLSGDKLSLAKDADGAEPSDRQTDDGDGFPLIRIESVVSLNPEAADKPESCDLAAGPFESYSTISIVPSGPGDPVSDVAQTFSSRRPAQKRSLEPSAAPSTVLSMRHKQGFDPSYARELKLPEVYKAMLTHTKLRHLYKCMDRCCSFTTNVKKRFEAHIIAHEKPTFVIVPGKKKKRKRLTGDWQRCPYCSQVFGGRTVSIHVDRDHGDCLYQCAYCFHRAMSPSYLFLHQNLSHVEANICILRCLKSPGLNEPAEVPLARSEVILPFTCRQGDCNEVFYILQDFEEHLSRQHSSLFIYTCDVCDNQTFNPRRLIGHYRLHNINAYQCVYCLTGTLSRDEMHHHLCNAHSNKPPVIVVREFDPDKGSACARTASRQLDRLRVIDLEKVEPVDPRLILAPREEDSVEEEEAIRPAEESRVSLSDQESPQASVGTPDPPSLCIIHVDSSSEEDGSDLGRRRSVEGGDLGEALCPSAALETPSHSAALETLCPSAALETPSHSAALETPSHFAALETLCPSAALETPTHSAALETPSHSTSPETPSHSASPPLQSPSLSIAPPSFELPCPSAALETPSLSIAPPSFELPCPSTALETPSLSIAPPSFELPCPSAALETSSLSTVPPSFKLPSNSASPSLELPSNSASQCLEPPSNSASPPLEPPSNSSLPSLETPSLPAPPPCVEPPSPLAPPSLDSSFDSQTTEGVMTIELPSDSEPCEVIATLPNVTLVSPGKTCEVNEGGTSKTGIVTRLSTKASLMPEPSAPDPSAPWEFGAISPEELEKTGLSGEDLYRCGYSGCAYPANDLTTLKDHLMVCDFSRNSQSFKCFHCRKLLKHLSGFLDHLASHSTARYGCALCPFRATGPKQVANHLRQQHKVAHTVSVPLNPMEWNSQTALFVVGPKEKSGKRGGSRKSANSGKKKHTYQPHEVHLLERAPIYPHAVSCGVCSFNTKVRINMVRHLKFHDSGISAPTRCPINPVPCLEKSEMMFDKMTNLAASSHAGPEETAAMPRFVPESERYVCGAAGCSYASCDENMLLHHVQALHRDETEIVCSHCPHSAPVPVGRMALHLKMHDARLYRCGYCPYHHYQRHLIERHLAERHRDRRPHLHVIREPATEPSPVPPDAPQPPSPSPRGPWRCNLCEFDCATRAEVMSHTGSAHNLKSQFKCGVCAYRSSSRHNFDSHFANKHPGMALAVVDVYSRVGGPDVPVFDTTPIWRRDMLGVKHIRGILLDEEQLNPQDLRAIARKEGGTDKRNLEELFGPVGQPLPFSLFSCTVCGAYSTKCRADMRDHLFRELKYAKFQCAHCDKKTCNRNYLQKHIPRAHPTEATPSSIIPLPVDKEIEDWVEQLLTTQAGLMKSVDSQAAGKQPAGKTVGHAQPSTKTSTPAKTLTPTKTSTPAKTLTPTKTSTPVKTSTPTKTLTPAKPAGPSKLAARLAAPAKPPPGEPEEEVDVTGSWSWADASTPLPDAESDPEEVLIVEEEPPLIVLTDSDGASPSKKKKRPVVKRFPCSHCGDKFATIRGLKCHIKLNHLAMGRWRCSMCKGTHNSEIFMKTHCASKHPEVTADQYFPNPNAEVVLSDAWWAEHYNISQLERDHRPAAETSDSGPATTTNGQREDSLVKRCAHCDFKSKSASEFRRHEMRHWIQKPYRCGYCDFTAIREFEIKQHSAKIHPFKEPLVLRVAVPLNPDIRPIKVKRKPDSLGDAEEVAETSVPQAAQSSMEPDVIIDSDRLRFFKCHYCPFRGDTMDTTYAHWQSLHQHKLLLPNGNTKSGTGLVFKCNELDFQDKTARQIHVTCGYCKKKGSQSFLALHQQDAHPGRPFLVTHSPVSKYECSACDFQSNTSVTVRKHWANRHPQLPLHFTVTQEKTSTRVPRPDDLTDVKYVCVYCDQHFESANATIGHLADYHSHLEQRYEVKTAKTVPEPPPKPAPAGKFKCPLCRYVSTEHRYVREHLRRHAKPYQCLYCAGTFVFVHKLRVHSANAHPGVEPAFKTLLEIENEFRNLIPRISSVEEPRRSVARKSTTLGPRAVCRQVARKSTVPLPRPSRISLPGDYQQQDPEYPPEFSFYGRQPADENYSKLKTIVQIGPSSIPMSVESMLKGINMAPSLELEDIKTLSPSDIEDLIRGETSH